MEEDIAGLTLQDDEDVAWLVDFGASKPVAGFDFCLVGCFLMATVVHLRRMDVARVIQGSPWTFNNHLLVFHQLEKGEDPLQVLLYYVDFWVQVHDLPLGFYNKQLAGQFRNFIGTFLDYDSKSLVFGLQKCLRYERLSLFCLFYGKLGHGESFCPTRLALGAKEVPMGWDVSLRAMPR
ncbi:hypothetical protein GOBAR_AA04400 [Gossypium barbadense]|uniref:Uncharacterized protein n=1 Tax=Gossypium barbadense TaxID=3634 RepID=A0A2P5YKU4_GOSBA|nr:hypothetical protein GOBAR_AA04400 [Gossypium barbadense]